MRLVPRQFLRRFRDAHSVGGCWRDAKVEARPGKCCLVVLVQPYIGGRIIHRLREEIEACAFESPVQAPRHVRGLRLTIPL